MTVLYARFESLPHTSVLPLSPHFPDHSCSLPKFRFYEHSYASESGMSKGTTVIDGWVITAMETLNEGTAVICGVPKVWGLGRGTVTPIY